MRCAVQREPKHCGRTERCYHRDWLSLRLVCALHGDGSVVLPDEGVASEGAWRAARERFFEVDSRNGVSHKAL